MTKAGFTFNGIDPGATAAVMLVNKHVGLTPEHRRRTVVAGPRPGIWDFGTELGERKIELDVVTGDNANVAGTDAAVRTLAQLLDPTNEVAGDKAFKQLVFDTESDRYWLAKLVSDPFTEYLPSAGKLKLTMRCADPFAYSTTQYVVQGGAATLTGFSAYRQIPGIPDVGSVHGWNLVKDGGYQANGAGITLHPNATIVPDATSVTGYAVRLVATAANQRSNVVLSVEPGKPFSFAVQGRADGVTALFVEIWWNDAGGNLVANSTFMNYTGAAYSEAAQINTIAPGNARTVSINFNSNGAGIFYFTALRMKQQATAPLAWTAADQQVLGNQGLSIQEATANLTPADADMETAGVASWTASTATLAKDTTKKFAGTQSLKVTNTAANGYAAQAAALAAAQAISLSARVIGGDAGAGLALYSTPSNALIASSLGASTDWVVRTVSGVIAGGDTGWQLRFIGGSGAAAVSNFDNCGVENKSYQTLNSGDGQEFTTTTRTASSVTETLPAGFDWTQGFAIVGTYRPDHAYNRGGPDRYIFEFFLDANNRCLLRLEGTTPGTFQFIKVRAGNAAFDADALATAPAAGDTVAWGALFIPGTGLYLVISKNGGAVATYSLLSAEAQLATFAAGTPTLYIGRYGGGAGNECDGTVGIDRIWSTVDATTLAKVQAAVTGNAVYVQQDESYESSVYRFDGSAVVENYAAGTLHVDVGGTYKVDPVTEITAGGAYTGNVTVTDANGNIFTWNGTLALNDVLKIDSSTVRAYLNGAVSMAGVQTGAKWPSLIAAQRNDLVVGGIPAATIKAIKTTFRNRWI